MSDITPRASSDNAQAIEPPADALTWRSSEERNRLLRKWRRAVQTRFGEQTRTLRVAWVLESLFNVKRGYAFASNEYLAAETDMSIRDVQKGLRMLDGEVIVRVVRRGRNTSRAIWPKRLFDMSTMDVPRHVHQVDTHNLRRIPRTQMAMARAAAELRDRRTAAERPATPSPNGQDIASGSKEGVAEPSDPKGRAPPAPPTPPAHQRPNGQPALSVMSLLGMPPLKLH